MFFSFYSSSALVRYHPVSAGDGDADTSSDPTKMVTRSMRIFELVIGLLVLLVLGSFVALLVKVSPIWKDVFHGYVPGPGIIRGGGLYIAVG